MFSAISKTIKPRRRDLIGGFEVARALPTAEQRSVGPFVFFDHMGPAKFAAGKGLDVRPHPHVGLATVTYLFEGEIMHRDSLGSEQAIKPGDVNWMVAGAGIVHSERTRTELRRAGHSLHGIQLWLALPKEHENTKPVFVHHPAAKLPTLNRGDVNVRLILGRGLGLKPSPVKVLSDMLYADAMLADRASFEIPPDHAERAIYVIDGAVEISGQVVEAGTMAVFLPEVAITIHAQGNTRFMILGGAPMDGPRQLWWNFVASDQAKLDAARRLDHGHNEWI
ncbi:MAG: pirin family protein [Rhodospirillaceae bacterium]|nr:pirin family protein [Rhodospirillaceae bacterium]